MKRSLLYLATVFFCSQAAGQQVIDFESLSLSKPDTFYVNFSAPGNDVGFTVDNIHFQCFYDTAFGGYWAGGFSYSNMTDSVTTSYTNDYSAKPAKGVHNSDQYAVFYNGYEKNPKLEINRTGNSKTIQGFYITNNTYAYNAMRDGYLGAKKFGGTTGDDPDWFKLTIRAYQNGTLKADSIEFYLADFRDSNNANDYIVNDWEWVNLLPLGDVDSLDFSFSSSDSDPQWGMNTPAYFCMDNLTIDYSTDIQEPGTGILAEVKIYPNPADSKIYVESETNIQNITLLDVSGRIVNQIPAKKKITDISVEDLLPGIYFLQLKNEAGHAKSIRFIKR